MDFPKFPDLAKEILGMVEVDQYMRTRNLREPDFWDPKVDRLNTERMKEIVSAIGWPTTSKVGGKASEAAWLLVQHADHDVDFQEQCLGLMKEAGDIEVLRRDIAMLHDRILVNRGQYQLYGTQFYSDPNGLFLPRPIDDVKNVDERRRSMGLCTLDEGIAAMKKKYK